LNFFYHATLKKNISYYIQSLFDIVAVIVFQSYFQSKIIFLFFKSTYKKTNFFQYKSKLKNSTAETTAASQSLTTKCGLI